MKRNTLVRFLIHWHGTKWPISLQWRHNERDGVSKHQPHDCLLNSLFRRRSQKTSTLRVTGLCAGNSPVTGEFPAQRASNAENVSIWWRHHVLIFFIVIYLKNTFFVFWFLIGLAHLHWFIPRCWIDYRWALIKVIAMGRTGNMPLVLEPMLTQFTATFEDFGARSRYLRHGEVIASHGILWDVITYPCPWYLLLMPQS